MKERSGVDEHALGYISEHRDIGDWRIDEAKLDNLLSSYGPTYVAADRHRERWKS